MTATTDRSVIRLQLGLAVLLTLAANAGTARAQDDPDAPMMTAPRIIEDTDPTGAPAEPDADLAVASGPPADGSDTGLAMTVAPPTNGQEPGPATGRQARVLTPIQGPLKLDGRYLGDISGEVGLDGSGLVDAARLLGLLEPIMDPVELQALRDRTGGQEKVSFDSLASEQFSLSFDTYSLSFNVRLDAGLRSRQRIDFGHAYALDPADFEPPSAFSAQANISLAQIYDHDAEAFRSLRGVTDVILNWGGFGGVTLVGGFDYDGGADERFRRHEIRLTKDLFGSAVRLVAGEFSPPVTGFQGSDRILGVSAGRAYSVIRPFQNVRPSGRREFVLDRAAFVEVEVNGIIVERLQLDPGPYSLSDFPFGQGANTVRFLVEDGAGRREIAVFDLYGGAALLDPGIVDFGVSAGVLQEGGEYRYSGTPAVSGYVRKGLTDALSVGASGQWVDDRVMAGATATWGSPLGLMEFGLAGSHNGQTGRDGFAASLDYVKAFSIAERDDTRVIISSQATSRDFQDAFERAASNPQAWRVAGQVSSRLDRYTFNLGAAFVKGRDSYPDERSVDLSLGRSFGRVGVTLSVGQRSIEGRDDEVRVGLSLTMGLGRRWNSQARYDSGDDFREVLLRRSSNGELNDVSGGLRFSRDSGRETLGGDLRYINNRFEAELISSRLASRASGGATSEESLWRVSTGLVYADRTFGLGRPGREGFIMARRHKSLVKSRLALTDSNGRAIARAGWFGPAVAPIDRAYSPQRLEIAVDPLPDGYDLGTGVITVLPGFGSGYAMTVGSDASRTAIGLLVNPDGTPAALIAGTIMPFDPTEPRGEPKSFFTNRAGRFVGDGLAPGRYRLVVGDRAIGEFIIPQDSEGITDVGHIQIRLP
jgi:outer membrane usher protein